MEIPKNLPVKELYADVAQPAAREVGKALADTVSAARFLLAPVEYVAAWRERWQRYLDRIARKVPDKNLRGADPEIAGPILLHLLHAKEDGLLAEMFLNLLARAIDKDRTNEAHPAYGQIVAQLHPDEAIILYHLKKRWFAQTQRAERDPATGLFRARINVGNDFPVHELAFPVNFYVYIDHLYHLGLAWMHQLGNQESLFEGPPGTQTGVRINNAIELMGFGLTFAAACVPDELPKLDAKGAHAGAKRAQRNSASKRTRKAKKHRNHRRTL
jgi:hypothetical protein